MAGAGNDSDKMNLVVISHKRCWASPASKSGYATHGGFPIQMRALSDLFNSTTLVLPFSEEAKREGEMALTGHNLSVVPLSELGGQGLTRKMRFPFWLLRNMPRIVRQVVRADAVHTPIPGDIPTFGMLLALLLRKRLFVRHCGNWFEPRTVTERFLKWFMESFAGGRNVMLATGGGAESPSPKNGNIRWIFSTSLTEKALRKQAKPEDLSDHGRSRLITVCRQEPYKGTSTIIESLPLILKQFPQVTLDVVGDGSALPEIKALARELQLDGHVRFHGKLEHERVLERLREADLFCYPTEASEGFPKVVLEALATGLPVVTTSVSVLPQLIGDRAGVVIEEATPALLAQSVVAILSQPESVRRFSRNALEIAQCFSLERWRGAIGILLEGHWGSLHSNA